jgi:F-type H+-transporting ATPase subunit a
VNKRLIIVGAIVLTVVLILLSIFVVQPPKPIIEITGEPLAKVGPLDILNTLFTSWVVMVILVIISIIAVRKAALIPSGFYNFFESIIEIIDTFVNRIAGEKNGRRFFPVIATLFIYIALANWLSLTPLFNTVGIYMPLHEEESEFHEHAVVFDEAGGVSVIMPGAADVEVHGEECAAGHEGDACRHDAIEEATAANTEEGEKIGVLFPFLRGINTDLMTPLSFALVAVFFIEYWGITAVGFTRYMSRFISFRSPIDFFVGILELVAEFAKLISFSFRLFGNMLAGEILLLVMTFLVAVASPILVIFYGLELFVGAIQAFVFGTLTLVFAVLAVSDHGPEEHSEEATHH